MLNSACVRACVMREAQRCALSVELQRSLLAAGPQFLKAVQRATTSCSGRNPRENSRVERKGRIFLDVPTAVQSISNSLPSRVSRRARFEGLAYHRLLLGKRALPCPELG